MATSDIKEGTLLWEPSLQAYRLIREINVAGEWCYRYHDMVVATPINPYDDGSSIYVPEIMRKKLYELIGILKTLIEDRNA